MMMVHAAVAQTTNSFEEFKRSREQEMSSFEADYKRGLDSLREAQNRDFALLLSGKWSEREVAKTPPVLEKPKPDIPPIVEDDVPSENPVVPVTLPEVEDNPNEASPPVEQQPAPSPVVHPDESVDDAPILKDTYRAQLERALQGASITPSIFFGNHTWVPVFGEPWPACERPLNSTTIAAFWEKCAARRVDGYMNYVQVQRQLLKLSDWGMLSLVDQWSKEEFSDEADAHLFKWYLLIQMGYDVRLMYNKAGVSLAYPFEQMFYGQSYMETNGKKYFMLDNSYEGSYLTYDGSHAGASKLFTMNQNPGALFPEEMQTRHFDFDFEGRTYSIDIPYNRYRASFYESIPQTELGFYFADRGAESFADACGEQLRKTVDSFPTQRQQVRFLYALVCRGIPYATDQEQFGYEKFCIAEESLHYSHADCEDRTFLLNYLIRTFVGAPTIGLNYPGHVAMAVMLDDVSSTDARFQYRNKTWVFCDPTYIGADVGMMPGVYASETPEVFE
jgi:hypothetical protein